MAILYGEDAINLRSAGNRQAVMEDTITRYHRDLERFRELDKNAGDITEP